MGWDTGREHNVEFRKRPREHLFGSSIVIPIPMQSSCNYTLTARSHVSEMFSLNITLSSGFESYETCPKSGFDEVDDFIPSGTFPSTCHWTSF